MIDTEPLAPWEITTTPRRETVSIWQRERIIRRAYAYLLAFREHERRYQRECDEYRRQGYRPHYCIHGTDLWVDFDNICQGCEDGADPRKTSLDLAWRDHDDMQRRSLAVLELARLAAPFPETLWSWAAEPMNGDLR
jgi:hypothetical protein